MTETLPQPKSRKESYLAKAAGMGVNIPEKPLSRTEQYLAAIAEGGGGGGGTSDFDQLTNRPKYNGSPMTGETNIPESTTYTAGDGIDIVAGVIKATNTGKARELTTDDYNWNSVTQTTTGTLDTIALWLLEPGYYVFDGGIVNVKASKAPAESQTDLSVGAIVSATGDNGYKSILLFNSKSGKAVPWSIRGVNNTGQVDSYGIQKLLTSGKIADNLTTSYSHYVLSANQGKVLKDLIDSIAIRGAGAPTTSTVGEVGQLYEDGTNGTLYQLKSIDITVTPNTYTWEEVGGGSGVTELTSADYDYPTSGTPDGVALWNLNGGIYTAPVGVKVYRRSNDTGTSAGDTYIIGKVNDYTTIIALRADAHSSRYVVVTNTGAVSEVASLLSSTDIVQSTGTSTADVMSQNAVTSMIYADPSTKRDVYLAGVRNFYVGNNVAASYRSGIKIGATQYSAPSSGIVFGDNYAVDTYTRSGVVGIGNMTRMNNDYTVCLGDFSIATQKGQVDISTLATTNTYGYNDSQYRLLTGLYDPQSAHDAATKGYVDGTTETYAIATSDWSALSASSPYDYQATVTATYTIGANTIAELLNDSPVEFATYGFAIGSISSQSVTIYSIGQPSASVSLKVNYKG